MHGIGCFRCTSMNGNNQDCEDTFNNTDKFYEADCWASRKDRIGLFPATECIKMTVTDGLYNILRNFFKSQSKLDICWICIFKC